MFHFRYFRATTVTEAKKKEFICNEQSKIYVIKCVLILFVVAIINVKNLFCSISILRNINPYCLLLFQQQG